MPLNEFQLISRLTSKLPKGRCVAVGPGDDAAAVRVGDRTILLTTDLLIEGVHFRRDFMTPEDIGFKAMRVNLSDVAAMGGSPRFALVSLGLPRATRGRYAERLFDGLRLAGDGTGVSIVGGDTNASKQLIVNVALIGEAGPRVLLRSGARAGDRLYVTGALGGSALGLAALKKGRRGFGAFIARHRRPPLRITVGSALARTPGVTALMDLSDGLAGDLPHLLEASGVGAEVNVGAIPTVRGLAAAARRLGEDPLALALNGGEDYELLFAASPRVKIPKKISGIPITNLGIITPKSRGLRWVRSDGTVLTGDFSGFRHF
ncbi:MAG TPA: thiamine-phosphate kinase [bacterium]|nr:thiamine-phosphate kinase [bacterium]